MMSVWAKAKHGILTLQTGGMLGDNRGEKERVEMRRLLTKGLNEGFISG